MMPNILHTIVFLDYITYLLIMMEAKASFGYKIVVQYSIEKE